MCLLTKRIWWAEHKMGICPSFLRTVLVLWLKSRLPSK